MKEIRTEGAMRQIIAERNSKMGKEIERLKNLFRQMEREVEALQHQGGSTLQFKEQIKGRLDGFLMTIQEIVDEALEN